MAIEPDSRRIWVILRTSTERMLNGAVIAYPDRFSAEEHLKILRRDNPEDYFDIDHCQLVKNDIFKDKRKDENGTV